MRQIARRYVEALGEADRHVRAIGPDQWTNATPCSAWDVRALVDHLVYETLWVPDLLEGRTLAEVGDRYEGDRLGADPVGAWTAALSATVSAVEHAPAGGTVHTSGGEIDAEEYLTQMLFDTSIHGWDVATAIGVDHTIPPDVATELIRWFTPQAHAWLAAGALAPPVEPAPEADPTARLIAMTGRDPAHPIAATDQSGAGQPGP